MKFFKIAAVLSVVATISSVHAAEQKKGRSRTAAANTATAASAGTSVTLADGRVATIENGRVTLAQAGKQVVAPGGRYTTRAGKVLLVGNGGRLTNSASLKAEPPPQPETKRAAAANNGQRHQTGSNL